MHRRGTVVLCFVILISLSASTCDPNRGPIVSPDSGAAKQPKLDPGQVDKDLTTLRTTTKFLDRRFFTNIAGRAYSPEAVVGRVLYILKDGATCPAKAQLERSYDFANVPLKSYLKSDVEPQVVSHGNVLYSEKVDRSASAGLEFVVFKAKVDDKYLSEITVTDVAVASIKATDVTDAWMDDVIQRIANGSVCGALMIETATLTTMHVKNYKRLEVDGKATGGVFAANTGFYNEEGQTRAQMVIAFDGTIPTPGELRDRARRSLSPGTMNLFEQNMSALRGFAVPKRIGIEIQ